MISQGLRSFIALNLASSAVLLNSWAPLAAADASVGSSEVAEIVTVNVTNNGTINATNNVTVWEVMSGDCKVSTTDSECVESPRYPNGSDMNSTCRLKVLDARILESSLPTEMQATFLSSVNFTISNGSLQTGDEAGMQFFNATHENYTIYWHVNSTNATTGWQLCARRQSSAEGPISPVSKGPVPWQMIVPVFGALVVLFACLAIYVNRRSATSSESEAGLSENAAEAAGSEA